MENGNIKKNHEETISSIQSELACELDNRVGDLVRELRTKKRVSQNDLAQSVGLGQSVISSYESGRTKPDTIMIEQICHALELDALAFHATILSRSKFLNRNKKMNRLSFDFFEPITEKVWDKVESFLEI